MLTLDKIYHAAFVLKDVARKTDLIEAPKLSKDCQLYLKTENLQATGSFKVRGAYYKISQLSEEESAKGVIACSAGNHAQGVALAATRRGIKSIVCMPDGAPIMKVENTKNLGAEVCLVPGTYDDAHDKAVELQEETGMTFIHPYDDEQVIAGQGTIGLEILDQLPDGACSRKLAEFMTDCLDDNGFFTIPTEEVAQKNGVSEAEVSWTLKVLQELEPYGIFAPDLKHSLLKQLEMQGLNNAPVSQVVKEHLQDVADGKISVISRALKLSTAEVRKCIDQIAKLNPRPLGEFGGKRNDYVVPDIIFRKDDGKWEIELNDGWVEDYHINDYYLKMMKESTDAQLGAYFQKKLERIRFVMNSIAQRRRTILQISEQILNVQEHFLDGTGFLKPMTMTDVAESLGIHTSTVSRAIKGKYIQYPCGTILMKHLFTASVSATEGSDAVGTMQIKELMKELIRNEDKNKPYSDQKLSSLLKERGIEISRRAVAKYREEIGIRGSFDRKAF